MHFFAFCQEETFFDNTHNGSKLHPVACEVLLLTEPGSMCHSTAFQWVT